MKFKITKTSYKIQQYRTLEIKSLKDLIKFIEKNKYPIIISIPKIWDDKIPIIEIYDDFRE
jgi:hypothetical protein